MRFSEEQASLTKMEGMRLFTFSFSSIPLLRCRDRIILFWKTTDNVVFSIAVDRVFVKNPDASLNISCIKESLAYQNPELKVGIYQVIVFK